MRFARSCATRSASYGDKPATAASQQVVGAAWRTEAWAAIPGDAPLRKP